MNVQAVALFFFILEECCFLCTDGVLQWWGWCNEGGVNRRNLWDGIKCRIFRSIRAYGVCLHVHFPQTPVFLESQAGSKSTGNFFNRFELNRAFQACASRTTDPKIWWDLSEIATHQTGVSIDIKREEHEIFIVTCIWRKKNTRSQICVAPKFFTLKNTSLTRIINLEVPRGWTTIGFFAP